jgi:hypothetical protein
LPWDPFSNCPPPSPSPVPTPSIAPASRVKGDGNHDGVVNLVDLSVLMSNFGKKIDFPGEIDLNNDGFINSLDYSAMVKLLISEGIIVSN